MKKIIILFAAIFVISSCKQSNVEYKYPKNKEESQREELGSLISGDDETGVSLFGGANSKKDQNSVNKYLWQAAMEVMSFAPIASASYEGGTIITEWYKNSKSSNERFKFNIFIKSNDFNATELSVKGLKQIKKNGEWVDAQFNNNLATELENKILTLARKNKLTSN